MFGRGRSRPVDDSDLPAGMAWRIHLGRRPICHTQPFIDGPRRLASHLVFPRCAVAIFSTRLHGFADRALALGFESHWIPLGQHFVTRCKCPAGLACSFSVENSRCVVGGRSFRSAPGPGPIDRLLLAGRAAWFYLSKIFWPSDLTFIYPQWQIDATNPVAYLWLIAAVVFAVMVYYGRRFFGRSVEVAALFFVTTLGPLLGFIMLYTFRFTFVADHYQYLASIGPIALASAGLVTLSRSAKNLHWLVIASGGAVLICLSLLTWRQSATYRDLETLWRTTLAKNPSCWMAYNNLGVVQFDKGNIDDAIDKYEQSLRLHPDYPEARYNLGGALLQKGRIDDAIAQCQKALELGPNDPDAHVVLGNAFMARRDIDGAISQYTQALALRAEDSNAHYNLATALREKGEFEQAGREYQKAREFEPREER